MIQQLVLTLGKSFPAIAIVSLGVFMMMTRRSMRTRAAVLLAWLFPGAGHLFLGRKQRGLVLGLAIILTFVAGMALADFRNIHPYGRHWVWGIAHAFLGLLSSGAALATHSLQITHDNPYYHVGSLYSGAAGLLNILLMVDAYDLGTKDESAAKSARTTATEATA